MIVFRKRLNRVVSLMVVMGLLVECATSSNIQAFNRRTIAVQSYSSLDRYTSGFDESDVNYDKESNMVSMTTVSSCTNESVKIFDHVSLLEDNTEEMENSDLTEEAAKLESMEDTHEIIITEDDLDLEDELDAYLCEEESELLLDYELTDEEIAESQIECTCSFDMEELVFEFSADLITEDGTVIEAEGMETEAFVTENGGLDAYVEIGGRNLPHE